MVDPNFPLNRNFIRHINRYAARKPNAHIKRINGIIVKFPAPGNKVIRERMKELRRNGSLRMNLEMYNYLLSKSEGRLLMLAYGDLAMVTVYALKMTVIYINWFANQNFDLEQAIEYQDLLWMLGLLGFFTYMKTVILNQRLLAERIRRRLPASSFESLSANENEE